MRRWLVLSFLLLASTVQAQAQRGRPVAEAPPLPTPLAAIGALPAQLGGFGRGTVTDFEGRPNGQGLGAAAEYRPMAGSGVATVYVYDRGQQGLVPGAETPAVQQELALAQREVDTLAGMRRYSVQARAAMAPVTAPSGAAAMSCLHLVLAFEGGHPADSYICLGALRQRFLKLRVTLPLAAPGVNDAVVAGLGREVVAAALR